ncbi:hypothetical protein GH733_000670, partial [Mirounga leonina]
WEKRGEKGAVAEDREEPNTEPDAKKSKAGAKKNEKEAAGEAPVLSEDPHPQIRKPHPVVNRPHSRAAPGMWMSFKPVLRRKEEAPQISCASERPTVQRTHYQLNFKSCLNYPISTAKEEYKGVGLLPHQYPLKASYGTGDEEHDQEGRVTVAEFDTFVLGTASVPKAVCWDEAFCEFLKGLASRKPLALCGGLSVAHEEIHLLYPKGNEKNAGFTPQKRQGFGELLRPCHRLTALGSSTPTWPMHIPFGPL